MFLSDGVQSIWPSYLDSRSRSQVKVKVNGFTLDFRVLSISQEPLCRFSLNFSPRFKVKVTGQGSVVYPSICVHSISSESFVQFSLIFTQMFFSVRQCAEHMTQLPRLKVKGFTLEFCVLSISPEPLGWFSLNFTQMFRSVRQCAERMTQLPRLKVTGQVMWFTRAVMICQKRIAIYCNIWGTYCDLPQYIVYNLWS